jgi:hypothetical protein
MTRLPDPEGKAPLRQCTSKPLADNDHDPLDAPGWLDGLHGHRGGHRYAGFPSLRAPSLVANTTARGSGPEQLAAPGAEKYDGRAVV